MKKSTLRTPRDSYCYYDKKRVVLNERNSLKTDKTKTKMYNNTRREREETQLGALF